MPRHGSFVIIYRQCLPKLTKPSQAHELICLFAKRRRTGGYIKNIFPFIKMSGGCYPSRASPSAYRQVSYRRTVGRLQRVAGVNIPQNTMLLAARSIAGVWRHRLTPLKRLQSRGQQLSPSALCVLQLVSLPTLQKQTADASLLIIYASLPTRRYKNFTVSGSVNFEMRKPYCSISHR